MQRYFFTLLTLWLTCLPLFSQPYTSVKTFNLRDGLASNVITGLMQTPDQLMWFSTWNGLTCYDGYRFTTFREAPLAGQPRRLTTNRLLNIQPSVQGNIWCVTYDLNVFVLDRATGQYVDVTRHIADQTGVNFRCARAITLKNGHTWLLSAEKGGPIVRVVDNDYNGDVQLLQPADAPFRCREFNWVFEDNDSTEWVITDRGIYPLDGSFSSDRPYRYMQHIGQTVYMATPAGRLSSYHKQSHQLADLDMPAGVTELRMLVTVGGRWLVAATNAGFVVYDTQQHSTRLISLPPQLNSLYDVYSLFADSRCRLWMGDERGNVVAVNVTDGTVELQATAAMTPLLKQSNSTFFHEDRYHTLWAATSLGFFGYYDEQQHRFVACPLRRLVTEPMIERWTFDTQGNLWFSGEHNLAMACFGYRNITHVDNMQEVRSIMFDHEQRIWAGTLAGDVAVYSAEGRLQGYLAPNGQLLPGAVRFSTHIYCLYEDRQQRVWIGTKGDGLYCRETDGRLTHYSVPQLPSNQIYDVHQDHQGRIWVGTFENGICLLTDGQQVLSAPGQLKTYPLDDFHKVRRISETADGTIIVSASNGLVTFSEHFSDPASIKFYAHKHVQGDTTSLMTSDVMQAFVTSHDTVFIATVGGGMQMVSAKDLLSDRIVFHSVNRLLNDYGIVLNIAQDRQQNLWIGRENSINMFEHQSGRLWRFGPSHIGEHTEMTEAKPAYDPLTGQLALATTDGFISFQPERLQENQYVPPLVFTGVQLHGEQEVRQMVHGDLLRLEADQRNLTISFAALDYQDNYMIRYAYRLEGIDRDWNNLGTEHSISFSNVPHGRHRLLVRSTNNYGTWVDNVRTLYIDARPTFWESWWGKLLYVLLGGLVIGIAVWIYRLHTRASMERKLNDMKTQFFTDVSHKLRTPLTLIGGPVAQVLSTERLGDTARHHLEIVERNAHRMLDLVNKMLTYSKEHHTYISDESIPAADPSTLTTDSSVLTSAPSTLPAENTRLLIVEDNDDLRAFLVSILESDYQVMQATNGREGLELAEREQPDFILTDVMMPEMDGLTMVHRIKENHDISHIPIVILSAKASMDDRLEGLKAGVNDYITKPFSATYLKQRMANIIANQHMMQQAVLEQVQRPVTEAQPTDNQPPAAEPMAADEGHVIRLKATNIVDSDKVMMEQLMAYIEDHLADPDLKIEDLATAVCLGRTVFYSKVKTLVGMSPIELLRHIRIQHAEDMVAHSSEPFSQIAYALGFSDPRYFSKCFKRQTGLTPSEYREHNTEQ